MSCQAIASKLNLHHGAVSWHLLKLGIEKGGHPPSNYRPRRSEECTFTRNGVLVRGFTEHEDNTLLELEAQGLTYTEMARRLGRKQNSVRGRLYTLARRDERLEALSNAEGR